MNFYIEQSESLPKPLTDEQTIEYFNRFQNGELQYRELLITHNLRLVINIANKYAFNKEDAEDYFIEGSIGLMKAVDKFQFEKNCQFKFYACTCIHNEIKMYLRSNKRHSKNISFEDIFHINESGTEKLDEEVLCSPFNLEDFCLQNKEYQVVADIIRNLPKFDQNLILMRYFAGQQGMSQKAVSEYLNVSQPQVCKLERKIFKKIKLQLKLQEHPNIIALQKKYKKVPND